MSDRSPEQGVQSLWQIPTLHWRGLHRATSVTVVNRCSAIPLAWWLFALAVCENHLGSFENYLPGTGIYFLHSPGDSNTQPGWDHCQRLTVYVLESSDILVHSSSQGSGSQGSLWQDKLRQAKAHPHPQSVFWPFEYRTEPALHHCVCQVFSLNICPSLRYHLG